MVNLLIGLTVWYLMFGVGNLAADVVLMRQGLLETPENLLKYCVLTIVEWPYDLIQLYKDGS